MTGYCGNVQGKGGLSASPKRHEARRESVSYPRSAGPSRARSPISEIKDRLTPAHIEALCRDWIPQGKRQGGWWVACCPWREDRNPSFGVSLTTGLWRDFASGERGDILDLSMRLWGDSLSETVKGFAEMLGIDHA